MFNLWLYKLNLGNQMQRFFVSPNFVSEGCSIIFKLNCTSYGIAWLLFSTTFETDELQKELYGKLASLQGQLYLVSNCKYNWIVFV